MKTYLFNLLSSFSKWSEEKDIETSVKNILCDRKWRLLNDDNVLELLVFQTDGVVKSVCNGKVIEGTWKYDFILKALEIHFGVSIDIFEAASFGAQVLVLKKMGGLESAILLDDDDLEMKHLGSVDSLRTYLENKENKEYSYQQTVNKRIEEQSVHNGEALIIILIFIVIAVLIIALLT